MKAKIDPKKCVECCECYPYNDAPIVRNIGVVASKDPVAIDQASTDLVNAEAALADSCLTFNNKPGQNKFNTVFSEVDWAYQLAYAKKIKLGQRAYKLIPL